MWPNEGYQGNVYYQIRAIYEIYSTEYLVSWRRLLLASTSSYLGFGPKIKNPVKTYMSNEVKWAVTNNNTVAANDNLAKKQKRWRNDSRSRNTSLWVRIRKKNCEKETKRYSADRVLETEARNPIVFPNIFQVAAPWNIVFGNQWRIHSNFV